MNCGGLGGVNEVLVVLVMAKKFGTQAVMHSGGVGLPELTVQMSIVNFVLFGEEEGLLEWQSAGGNNFVEPARCENGFFVRPEMEGYGILMKEGVVEEYGFPEGRFWTSEEGLRIKTEDIGGNFE